jgi:four helix bundle protein
MRDDRKNIIVEMTFNFSLEIIDYTEKITKLRKYGMASQLFDSGTSIGANSREAQNAESTRDFTHKFKIAAKEADETQYWLELYHASVHYPDPPDSIFETLESIIKIISKIISSNKNR